MNASGMQLNTVQNARGFIGASMAQDGLLVEPWEIRA
jgi:hypothetical protein